MTEDDVEGDVGTVEQAFTNITTFKGGGFTTTHTDMGSSTDRTCFLTAVFGSFDGGAFVDVNHDPDTNRWTLSVSPPDGHALYARAACVGTILGRTDEAYWMPTATQEGLLSTDPDAQCFLTRLNSSVHHTSFDSLADKIWIFQETNGNWYVSGEGNATGGARCITATKRGNGGSLVGATGVILSPHFTGDQCFLTALGGRFRSDSATSGISTYRTVDNRWLLSAGANKFARARCAR